MLVGDRRKWRLLLGLVLGILACLVIWICLSVYREYRSRQIVAQLESRGISTLYFGSHEFLELQDQYPFIQKFVSTTFPQTLFIYDNDGVFSDADVILLPEVKRLTSLSLSHPKISEKGLPSLSRLSSVEGLTLEGMTVHDDWIMEIKKMPRLEHLILRDTSVTPAGLTQLRESRSLSGLAVSGSGITDKSLQSLGQLQNLKFLCLRSVNVSEAALGQLKESPKLEDLSLICFQITELGVRQIAELSHLKRLVLYDSNITREDLAKLKASRPNLRVTVSSAGLCE